MLVTIIAFIIVLGLLIFVHELGHFYTARKFGVRAEEFGFGIPPRIFGFVKTDGKWKFIKGKNKDSDGNERTYKNTIYSLNWFPVGGFVTIKGQDGDVRKEPDSFGAQKIWKRIIILASGVVMNFILAALIFCISFTIGTPQALDDISYKGAKIRDEKIRILGVVKDSPAGEQGVKLNDELLTIDNQTFARVETVQEYIGNNSEKELNLKLKRGQEVIETKITPRDLEFENEVTKKGIGVVLAKTGIVSYPFHIAIWKGITTTLLYIKAIVLIFGLIIKDLFGTRELTSQISGPVGIAVMTGQIVEMGFVYLLSFTAILSINLGVINLFPFPGLDGGRIIGLIVEAIRRKPNNQKVEAIIHNTGLIILLALFALITYQDVVKYGGKFLEKFSGG